MNEITAYNSYTPTQTARQEITAAMFDSFVGFVNRTEKTTKVYINNLRQFMAWLKYAAVRLPERKDIIAYNNWLSSEHAAICYAPDTIEGWQYRTDNNGNTLTIVCKPNTVKLYMQSVRQFFRWLAAEHLYDNIADNIHAPKVTADHKKGAFTPSQVVKIEESIKDRISLSVAAGNPDSVKRSTEQGKRLYAMYLLAVNAGLRTIELSRAEIKDLETIDGNTYLYVWGKGHSEADQKKPIAPEVKAAIDDYIASRTDNPTRNSPLFAATGNRSHGKAIAETTISTMLKTAMREAGFDSDRLTAHSLRHTAGRNVMNVTGNNIYKTQMYMRHENPATTEIYLEYDREKEDTAIAQQLYNHYHGNAETMNTLQQLNAVVGTMTEAQISQLLNIAKAMKG